MSSLLQQNISAIIESSIADFISVISTEYKMPREELVKLWNGEKLDTKPKDIENKIEQTPKDVKPKDIENKIQQTEKTCKYIMLRGAKKGTLCGCAVKTKDSDFCKIHDKKQKKPKERKTANIPEPIDMQKSKVLRRNKSIDRLWHGESGMIFSDQKIVTHRLSSNGTIDNLTQQDISVCRE